MKPRQQVPQMQSMYDSMKFMKQPLQKQVTAARSPTQMSENNRRQGHKNEFNLSNQSKSVNIYGSGGENVDRRSPEVQIERL